MTAFDAVNRRYVEDEPQRNRQRRRLCPRDDTPMDERAGMSVCPECGYCPNEVQVSR